jgi:hypothetical protein
MQRHLAVFLVGTLGFAAGCDSSLNPVGPTSPQVHPPGALAQGKPQLGCPPASDLGAFTFPEFLELPNIQAGLAEGVYDEASLAALFSTIDKNGDGMVCAQSITPSGKLPNPASGWQFLYNAVDNIASVPS